MAELRANSKNTMSDLKDTSEVTACVCDMGMFMPVALKLPEHFKKVYYTTPTEKGFQEIGDFVLGDGFKEIHRLDDFLAPSVFDEIDLFVFPYILNSGLQEHLVQCGKAVWGSRRADELEMYKGKFYDMLKKVGLPVPEHEVIVGMKKLRHYLIDHDDVYVKISRYRGTMDTWHHETYQKSRSYLDQLTCTLGPFQDTMPFYVIQKIDTPIEGGIDTYCIDGQWPNQAVLGYEKKNECYLAVVKPMDEMDNRFRIVNEKVGPILAEYQYRQFFSTEVRVKGKQSFFIDPTCRTASPAGEEMLDLFGNIGDIVWRGANGELVEPDITAEFAGEAYIHWTGDEKEWKCMTVPKNLPATVKLYGCAEHEGAYHWPPEDEEVIGCVVATGDSPEEVIDAIKETAEALQDNDIRVDVASFVDLLQEIEKAAEQGIEFSGDELPEPASVME